MAKRWLHNLVCGAGTLLELMPPPRRHMEASRRILAKTDAELLYGDWEKIGADFRAALGQVKAEANGGRPAQARPGSPGRRPAA
jgi:hypothetical protein